MCLFIKIYQRVSYLRTLRLQVDSKAVDAEKKLLPKSCELKVGRICKSHRQYTLLSYSITATDFQFQGFTPRLVSSYLIYRRHT